jgi:DNA-binding SARP family transcriptional activator
VRVLLLGEVEVWASDRPLDVGLPRQQAVLAALLVAAPRPVPVAALIDQVWGDSPPASVRNVLYSHVSRIRRMFREIATVTGDTPGHVRRRAAGYAAQIDVDAVDLHVFRRLVEEAADAKLAEPDRLA